MTSAANEKNETTPREGDLVAALRIALPYVQKIAATAPTEMLRQQRQIQAVKDVRIIKAALGEEA